MLPPRARGPRNISGLAMDKGDASSRRDGGWRPRRRPSPPRPGPHVEPAPGGTAISPQHGRVLRTFRPRARDDSHRARRAGGDTLEPEPRGLPTHLPGRPSVFGRRMSQNHRWLLLASRYWPILTLRGDLARGDADEQGACVTDSGSRRRGPGGVVPFAEARAVCKRAITTKIPTFLLYRVVPGSEEIYDLGERLAARLASPEGLGDAFG